MPTESQWLTVKTASKWTLGVAATAGGYAFAPSAKDGAADFIRLAGLPDGSEQWLEPWGEASSAVTNSVLALAMVLTMFRSDKQYSKPSWFIAGFLSLFLMFPPFAADAVDNNGDLKPAVDLIWMALAVLAASPIFVYSGLLLVASFKKSTPLDENQEALVTPSALSKKAQQADRICYFLIATLFILTQLIGTAGIAVIAADKLGKEQFKLDPVAAGSLSGGVCVVTFFLTAVFLHRNLSSISRSYAEQGLSLSLPSLLACLLTMGSGFTQFKAAAETFGKLGAPEWVQLITGLQAYLASAFVFNTPDIADLVRKVLQEAKTHLAKKETGFSLKQCLPHCCWKRQQPSLTNEETPLLPGDGPQVETPRNSLT